ncbi:unnamed protein product [Sphenostylis stenocarpa]|uniref:Uncharacterized protein n=1 Tax=Sphenostylis stenocarpa TaxID=92480 RepID=A0AA86W3T3_9FABA|nr:unnamed protein product [Sphenostylis stenocarpa]
MKSENAALQLQAESNDKIKVYGFLASSTYVCLFLLLFVLILLPSLYGNYELDKTSSVAEYPNDSFGALDSSNDIRCSASVSHHSSLAGKPHKTIWANNKQSSSSQVFPRRNGQVFHCLMPHVKRNRLPKFNAFR